MRWFQFRVRSLYDGPGRQRNKRRVAFVWVKEKGLDEAERMARSLLSSEGWATGSLELSMRPTLEEMTRLDRAQSFAHKRALTDGAFVYFEPLQARATGTY